MKKYNKAAFEFKKILKVKPEFTDARVNLVRIYIDWNKIDLALKEIKKAEEDITYTNYLKIVSQKALAYYKKGEYALSKKWMKEAFSFPKGKNCFVYLNRGKVEMALGNLNESEKFLKKALSVCRIQKPICEKPSYDEHLALGELYIKKKNKKRARYHLNLFLQKVEKGNKVKKAKKLLQKIS